MSAVPEMVGEEEPTVRLLRSEHPYRGQEMLVAIARDLRIARKALDRGDGLAAATWFGSAQFTRGLVAIMHGGRPSAKRLAKMASAIEAELGSLVKRGAR